VTTISWRINAERLVLFGWTRAILMQLAHPLIAAGVLEHSSFRKGRLAAGVRLHHTVRAMLSLTFGSPEQRERTLAQINGIHRHVNGVLETTVGCHAAGTPYSAEMSPLLVWVHATLLESIPMVYDRLVAPVSDAERDTYCREAAPIVLALGARDDEIPRTWDEVQAHLKTGYASGKISVGPDARTLAAAVLEPPFAPLLAPLARINWLLTVGLLPPFLREQYGFAWRAADEKAFARWTTRLRMLRRRLPDAIALWPEARRS
jgi:uncharacterized protein (DUF2236 family)